MKLNLIVLLAALTSCGNPDRPETSEMNPATAGRYYFQKDSIGWRLIKEVPGPGKGSGVVTYSQYMDSTSAVATLADVIRIRKQYIEAKAWEPELKDMEALMDKVSGKEAFTGKPGDLVGDWILTSGRDSMAININSFMTVSGPGVNGKIYADGNAITLKNILPADTQFHWTGPGQLAGVLNNTPIKMIKS